MSKIKAPLSDILKNKNSKSLDSFLILIDENKKYIQSLNFDALNKCIKPIIYSDNPFNHQMLFYFFQNLNSIQLKKILNSFSIKKEHENTTDILCGLLLNDDNMSYDFYHFSKDFFWTKFEMRKKILSQIFNNNYIIPLLKNFFHITHSSSSTELLQLFFDEDDLKLSKKTKLSTDENLIEKNKNQLITLFFKDINFNRTNGKDFIKEILHLLYKNNIDFICEPQKFPDNTKQLYLYIIQSDSKEIFSEISKKEKIPSNFWQYSDISYQQNLIEFININKNLVSVQNIKDNILYCSLNSDISLMRKLYESYYIQSKEELLMTILENLSYFMDEDGKYTSQDDYNNIILFINETFELCISLKDFDIMKKIDEIQISKPLKNIIHSLNEKHIIHDKIEKTDLINKIKKRI